MLKRCKFCEKPFITTNKNKKYCSKKCLRKVDEMYWHIVNGGTLYFSKTPKEVKDFLKEEFQERLDRRNKKIEEQKVSNLESFFRLVFGGDEGVK